MPLNGYCERVMSSSLDWRNLYSHYELRSHYLAFHVNLFDDHQSIICNLRSKYECNLETSLDSMILSSRIPKRFLVHVVIWECIFIIH